MLTGRKLNVLLHLVIWAVLFILPTYLIFTGNDRDFRFIQEVWFQFACYGIIFYTSYHFLAPGLFFRGRKIFYFVSIALLILVFTAFLGFYHQYSVRSHEPNRPVHEFPGKPGNDDHEFRPQPHGVHEAPPPARNWPVFNFFLMSCLVAGLSLGLRFSGKLRENEKQRKEAEKEKLNTELALLKHQINPHFLFNTLNSIYSLALIKSDFTAEAVMKLSDMMRYVIQEVGHESVPLSLELEYIAHYVELQKIRLSEKVQVRLTISGDHSPYSIPPMLLVPFVENAFKHGISSHENALISIDIRITEASLSCVVVNQVFAGREKQETFGIGLTNTQKRLGLVFPGRHRLLLTENGKTFTADLQIDLT